jgi:predicted AAA+ superfamily ATPase
VIDDPMDRIAQALERLAPAPLPAPDFSSATAFVWHTQPDRLEAVPKVARISLNLLVGVDRSRDTLLANTRQFAKGLPANNALLWGARGMGKSSLVKAIHADVQADHSHLKIVELQREGQDDTHYKSLKAILDGGIEGRPENVVLYATSNRRHLMPRDMIENEQGSAINPAEAVEEKVSLSDRFGLWLGFHACDQDQYLAMIDGYCDAHGLKISPETLRSEAIEWQATRGSRSGRVAWQFFTDLAGRHGVKL